MTPRKFGSFSRIVRCAAIFAAHFVCVGTLVAQEVTFRSADNSVVATGRFVAFDGEIVTVTAGDGLVSFRANGMSCEGQQCPDLAAYTARIRIVGAARMAYILLPALIDVYARDNDFTIVEDASGFVLLHGDGSTALSIDVMVKPPDEAFATFLSHRADALLSMRELRSDEVEAAQDAGLGRLSLARQGRILALDALVPVVSATAPQRSISLAALTGELSGSRNDFEVHLPVDLDGQLQGFEDRFMKPFGMTLAQPDVSHDAPNTLLGSVAQASIGLSLVPFGATQNTQPLALSGSCGLQSEARFLTMKTEDYPLTFPMFLYLPQRRQHAQVVDFIDWLRSPSAQLVIRRAGFVDLAAVPIPLSDQGDRLANAIANAGAEVPLIELQRMVRLLSPSVRMSSTFRFEPGSTRLDGQSRSNVMQLAQAIRDGRFGGRELMLVGFSDGRGPAVANRDLSAARAEAVRRDLERALGGNIPANVRMETDAFGEALPMACDDTIWGQQTNRRVELWVRDMP